MKTAKERNEAKNAKLAKAAVLNRAVDVRKHRTFTLNVLSDDKGFKINGKVYRTNVLAEAALNRIAA